MGGRSLEEKGVSGKVLFRQVRDLVNEAAKEPGFFDDEIPPKPDIQLYCKGNKDASQIGDCPFTQFLQLVLIKKGLRYDVCPMLSTNISDWIVTNHKGKLPVLKHKEISLSDPIRIAEFIDDRYSLNPLMRTGTNVYTYKEILEKTKNFYPTLTELILNKDPVIDEELCAKMDEQLDLLEDLLRSTPGRFLGGLEMTLADLYICPQLFHAVISIEHFKKRIIFTFSGESTRPSLESYLDRFLRSEGMKRKGVYYGPDQIIYGWKVARNETAKKPIYVARNVLNK